MSNNNTGDMVYVSDYSRDDGTHVDDYYRAKPGGGSVSENNYSTNTNGFDNNKTFSQECPALTKLFGSANMDDAPVPVPDPEVILKGGVTFIRIVLEGAIKIAKIAIEAIAVAAPVVAALYGVYKTGKAVYDKVSDIFSSKEAQSQIKTVNTAIRGLRETQGLQKRNIDLLTKKTASAKNQDEYAKLYQELTKQQAQYNKNDALLGRIEYSAQQQDYETLMQDLEEYQNNAQETINESNSTDNVNSDWMHPNSQNLGDALNAAFSQPAYADGYNPQVQNSTPATNQSNEGESKISEDSSFTSFKTGITKTVEQAQTLIKPIIKEAVNHTILGVLNSQMGKIALDLINQLLNADAKDAADLMQISLYGPESLEPTTDYTPISKEFNAKTNEALGITGTDIEIPKDWNGVVFDENSHLAQSLNNSSQHKEMFQKYFGIIKKNDTFEIYPKDYGFKFKILKSQDANLFKSIHNGTIINPKMENGYFTGILYDKYDFTLILDGYMKKEKFLNTDINNLAYYLQGTSTLNNYYLIVPIKIKL